MNEYQPPHRVRPADPAAAYRALIDGFVADSSTSVAANRILDPERYPAAYPSFPASPGDQAAINAFIGGLAPEQRRLLALMLKDERHGAFHDVLADLSWWTSAGDLGLTYRGLPVPMDVGEGSMHHDFVGRCTDWEWPSS